MTQPADPGFVADVKRAASIWTGAPVVPLVYLALGLSYAALTLLTPIPPEDCAKKTLGACPIAADEAGASAALSLLIFPVALFQVGLAGTARVWYARRFSGAAFPAGEVWSLSWRFFGRFFLLGLIFAAVVLPIGIASLVIAFQQNDRLPLLLGSALAFVLGDVLFTFATAGLALYNESAWNAFKGGLTILRTTWPACALYALVPPMALQLLAQGNPGSLGRPLTAVVALVSPLLTLLFAGAAVSFLLRRWPPLGHDGSLAWRPTPREVSYPYQRPPPTY